QVTRRVHRSQLRPRGSDRVPRASERAPPDGLPSEVERTSLRRRSRRSDGQGSDRQAHEAERAERWTSRRLCRRLSSARINYAHVAQMAERVLGKDEVSGSIPDMGSISNSNTRERHGTTAISG